MTGYKREPGAEAFCVVCSACRCESPQAHCDDSRWRPVLAGYRVCARCKQRMMGQLTAILEDYALTVGELQPGSGSGRGADQPIGVRTTALSMLAGHDLLGVLGSWEADWRETLGLAPAPARWQRSPAGGLRRVRVPQALSEIVGFLLANLDRACRLPVAASEYKVDWWEAQRIGDRHWIDIAGFATELRHLDRDMRIAARVTTLSRPTFPCPTMFDDGPCAVRLKIDQTDLDEQIICPLCQTRWTASRLMAVATSDPDYAMTADALGIWLKVTHRQLCRWANAGRVRTLGPLFNLMDTRAAIFADQQMRMRARPPVARMLAALRHTVTGA